MSNLSRRATTVDPGAARGHLRTVEEWSSVADELRLLLSELPQHARIISADLCSIYLSANDFMAIFEGCEVLTMTDGSTWVWVGRVKIACFREAEKYRTPVQKVTLHSAAVEPIALGA